MRVLMRENQAASVRRNRKDDFHLLLLLHLAMKRDSNFLDIGSNIGLFLRGIDRIAPDGHHIAYEPVPALCTRLRREFPHVEIRQAALSNVTGSSQFIHVLGHGRQGFSKLDFGDGGPARPGLSMETETLTVVTERLDDNVPEGWLPHFVKIDVEGAEMLVLEGASETLRKAVPVVAFEHVWDADTSPAVYQFLSDLSLRIFDMDGNGPFERSKFLEALQEGDRWNWLAHE